MNRCAELPQRNMERTFRRLWEGSTRSTSSLYWWCPLEVYLDRPTSRFWFLLHEEKNGLGGHPLGRLYWPERGVVQERSLAVYRSRRERDMIAFDLPSRKRIDQSERSWSTAEAHLKPNKLVICEGGLVRDFVKRLGELKEDSILNKPVILSLT